MSRSIWHGLAGVLVGLAALAFSVSGATAQSRIALVVTNEAYVQGGAALSGPHGDGARFADALRRNGFDVTVVRDVASAAGLTDAVTSYAQRLKSAGPDAIGYVFYSGHSLVNRQNGSNYLIPTGANLRTVGDVTRLGVSLDKLASAMRTAARLNFVVIDACRAYPVPGALVGCVEPRPERGFVKMVSARLGRTASDQPGSSGRLAAALAAALVKPGAEGGQLMRAAAAEVSAATGQRQIPIVVDGQGSAGAFRSAPPRFVTTAPSAAATDSTDLTARGRVASGLPAPGTARRTTEIAPPPILPAPAPPAQPRTSGEESQRPTPPAAPTRSADVNPESVEKSASADTLPLEDDEPAPKTRGVRAGAAAADWDVVPVFFGTNRKAEKNPKRASYSADRDNRLELGQALVTVPKSHRVPNLERPWVYKVPFTQVVIYGEPEDPAKHFTLKEVRAVTEAEWLRLIRQRLAASKDYDGQALIFVHGFQTSFDYALFRTAQISYDLKFDGAPFVYSWPSRGVLGSSDYRYDRESAEGARPHLRQFIELVAAKTGAKRVSLIAHSMGHQVLMPVLEDIKRDKPAGVTISEVILAAPDMERIAFENLARELKGVGRGLTLYASASDVALKVSREYWGADRAGDVPADGPIVVPGLDTIDVTNTSTDWFGLNHSTYAEKTELIDDIAKLLRGRDRKTPPERNPSLLQITANSGVYWKVPVPGPAAPGTPAVRSLGRPPSVPVPQ